MLFCFEVFTLSIFNKVKNSLKKADIVKALTYQFKVNHKLKVEQTQSPLS